MRDALHYTTQHACVCSSRTTVNFEAVYVTHHLAFVPLASPPHWNNDVHPRCVRSQSAHGESFSSAEGKRSCGEIRNEDVPKSNFRERISPRRLLEVEVSAGPLTRTVSFNEERNNYLWELNYVRALRSNGKKRLTRNVKVVFRTRRLKFADKILRTAQAAESLRGAEILR